MRHNKRVKKREGCSLSLVIFLFLLFIISTNSALGAQTNLIIKGNIANIPTDSSKLIHLYSYYGNDLSEEASASVNKQGDFKFEIKDTLRQGLYKIGIDETNSASIVLSGENDVRIKLAPYGRTFISSRTAAESAKKKKAPETKTPLRSLRLGVRYYLLLLS